jgi:tetratricopeptide (TPR) repeat protein
MEAYTYGNLSRIQTNLGRYPEALQSLERTLTIMREIGERSMENEALCLMCRTLFEMSRYQEALTWGQEALESAQELSSQEREAEALGRLAAV